MRGKQLLILGTAAFLITVMATMQSLKGGTAAGFEISEKDVGKMCLSGALMIGSRGGERTEEGSQEVGGEENAAEGGMQKAAGENGTDGAERTETAGGNGAGAEEGAGTVTSGIQGETADGGGDPAAEQTGTNPVMPDLVQTDGRPLVVIYHTHATESYQPASEGNFHVLEEKCTVREVGNILTAELEKQGIQVVHDKTIHDNPSYNQSYSRSLATVNGLLAKYPEAAVTIDLHRDAAGYSGGAGKTVTVGGETTAKYNLVVGNGNPNAQQLKNFANAVNGKAEEMYPGFGGRIIEKAYKFNQYVSDRHILLEVGNNENNIREADACARYFATVLAAVIEDMQ